MINVIYNVTIYEMLSFTTSYEKYKSKSQKVLIYIKRLLKNSRFFCNNIY
jgi:hypothetical protein